MKNKFLSMIIPALVVICMTVMIIANEVQNRKRITADFGLSNVFFNDKWLENNEPYVSINTSGEYKGYEDYFLKPKVLKLKSVDYYEAVQVQNGIPYMSLWIWIEVPYYDARRYQLLDDKGEIIKEKLLSEDVFIKNYCTIISMYTGEDE